MKKIKANQITLPIFQSMDILELGQLYQQQKFLPTN